MIKVKVSYTTIVEETIEVDEKFYALTGPGGWNELSYKEQKTLTEELLEEVINHTGADCHRDILCIEEDDSEELMYES